MAEKCPADHFFDKQTNSCKPLKDAKWMDFNVFDIDVKARKGQRPIIRNKKTGIIGVVQGMVMFDRWVVGVPSENESLKTLPFKNAKDWEIMVD